jgi:hypothetical protein
VVALRVRVVACVWSQDLTLGVEDQALLSAICGDDADVARGDGPAGADGPCGAGGERGAASGASPGDERDGGDGPESDEKVVDEDAALDSGGGEGSARAIQRLLAAAPSARKSPDAKSVLNSIARKGPLIEEI